MGEKDTVLISKYQNIDNAQRSLPVADPSILKYGANKMADVSKYRNFLLANPN